MKTPDPVGDDSSSGLFKSRDWLLLGPMGAIACALAIWGFLECHKEGCPATKLQVLIKTLDVLRGRGDFTFENDPWQLVIAQYLIPGIAIFAAAKLFLLNLRRDVRVALARKYRNHTIVCGLGDTGRSIVENLFAAGKDVVAVDLNSNTINAAACEHLGVPVIRGDANSRKTLLVSGFRHAKALVLCTGDDSTNLEIALQATSLANAQRPNQQKLAIHSEMRTDWLFSKIVSNERAHFGSQLVEFGPFSLYRNAARLLLSSPTFYRCGRSFCVTPTHLIIIGFGSMGREIALHAIRTTFALPDRRAKITIVDKSSDTISASFIAEHPGIDAVADIKFKNANVSTNDPAELQAIIDICVSDPPLAVVVCLADDEESLFTGLSLRSALDSLDQFACSVFVRLPKRPQLGVFASKLEQAEGMPDRLKAFGSLSYLTNIDVLIGEQLDRIAQANHSEYLGVISSIRQESRAPAQLPWESLPEIYKQSNRQFADHLAVKLRASNLRAIPTESPKIFRLRENEVEALAEMEHCRWLVESIISGWKLGNERNDYKRLHPALVRWSELNENIRDQNRNAMRKLPHILAAAGFEIKRERIIQVNDTGSIAFKDFDQLFPSTSDEHLLVALETLDSHSMEIAKRFSELQNASIWLFCPWKIDRSFNESPGLKNSSHIQQMIVDAECFLTDDDMNLLRKQNPSPSP